MKPIYALRLSLDLAAATLLLFALSYWWLGNLSHEIAGTVLFLLLVAHNAFNRRWYGSAVVRKRVRSRIDLVATTLLLLAMLALLATSLPISETLSGLFPFAGGSTARQLHLAAAYWCVVLVAIHLGMRWPILMAAARRLFGIARDNRARTFVLRAAVLLIVFNGVRSSFVLGLGGKLGMNMTLEWWDFETSVVGFFLHWLSIVGLFAALAHYLTNVVCPKVLSTVRREGVAQSRDAARP